MSRVLLLDAFPAILGDGAQILGAFRSGVARQKHDIEQYHLSYLKIHDCVACSACQSPCVLQDDGNAVLRAIGEAKVIAIAFPLSSYGFPSVLTALLDRLVSIPEAKQVAKQVIFFVVGTLEDTKPILESCALLCQREGWQELHFLAIPPSKAIGQERFLGQCETAFQYGLRIL
jgi:multimeric flavodoxin WrbA